MTYYIQKFFIQWTTNKIDKNLEPKIIQTESGKKKTEVQVCMKGCPTKYCCVNIVILTAVQIILVDCNPSHAFLSKLSDIIKLNLF